MTLTGVQDNGRNALNISWDELNIHDNLAYTFPALRLQ